MATTATVWTSRSWSSAYWCASSEYVARSSIISIMSRAYGRSASMRAWLRRSLAAATISMALVILRVFWTDAMRRRMSRRVATSGLRLRRLDLLLERRGLGLHLADLEPAAPASAANELW